MEAVYNGFLVLMLGMWLLGLFKLQGPSSITEWTSRHRRLIPAALWTVFLAFLVGYILLFNQLNQVHDIPEAVSGAVNGFDRGLNPYVAKVVPRFGGHDALGYTLSMGTYNYMPLDLLVYSGMHALLGFAGFPEWFVISNILFSTVAFVLFHDLVPLRWRSYIPVAGMVILFFSFDNCSLTVLLMVAAMFSLMRLGTNSAVPLAIFLMGLAILTKIYAAIPFAVLVLWLLEDALRARSPSKVGAASAGVAGSLGAGALLILPFGLTNVLDSAAFFHLSASARDGTMSGGTLLADIAMNSPYYAMIAVGALIASLAASIRLRNLFDRVVLVSIVFMMVAAKSSYSLMTVPGLFLVVRFYGWSRRTQIPEPFAARTSMPPSVKLPREDLAG